jgi:CRP-like cAMP-binding protein
LIENLILYTIGADHVLFKEGDLGNFFYIVKSGELVLSFPDLESKTLHKGDTFGELALIQMSQRSGTAISLTPCEIYCLEGCLFRTILKRVNLIDHRERSSVIKYISIFKGLTANEMSNLADGMMKCEFDKGEPVIIEGDRSESLFIIIEGSVGCIKDGDEVKRLSSKDYFGESSILFQTKRSMSIIALETTICYQITKNQLKETLGESFRLTILKSVCRESFVCSKFMKNFLLEKYFDRVFDCFNIKFYKDNEIVFSKSVIVRKIVIVIQGSLYNVIVTFILG